MPQKIILTILLFTLTLSSHASLREWREYRSDHVTLITDENEKKAIELLKDVEDFRKVVLQVTTLSDEGLDDRIRILMFKRGKEYNLFRPSKTAAGFYINTKHGPLMFIGPKGRGLDSRSVFFHEYVHYLMLQKPNSFSPFWFREGFAELLAATEIKNGAVVLGSINEARASTLRAGFSASTEELVKPDWDNNSAIYRSKLYASSWLMTHFLQIGTLVDNHDLKEKSFRYMNDFRKNYQEPLAVFERNFGMTTEEMDDPVNNSV